MKSLPLAPFWKCHLKDDPNAQSHGEKIDIGFRLYLFLAYSIYVRGPRFNGCVQNSLKQQPDHLQSLTHFFFLSDLVLFWTETNLFGWYGKMYIQV